MNLQDDKLFKAAGIDPDKGAKSWAKYITGTFPGKTNTWAFDGSFVSGKTGIDLEDGKDHVFLVHGRTGGKSAPTFHYTFVVVKPDGAIINTGISQTMPGEKGKWLSDPMFEEVSKLLGPPSPSLPSTPTVMLSPGAAAALALLRPVYDGSSDGDITHAAFELLGAVLNDEATRDALLTIMDNQGGSVPDAVTTAVKAFAAGYSA